MAHLAPLQVVQASAWNGFRYHLLDAGGAVIGHFEFPDFGQARNARLKWHPAGSAAGDVHLLLDRDYRVDHEYLSRGWVNDLRFRLLHGDEVLAHIDVHHVRGRRWPEITLEGAAQSPPKGQLARCGTWWRRGFELRELGNGHLLARMQETAALMLKRRYLIEGERLSAPVKGLLAVVVTSLRL